MGNSLTWGGWCNSIPSSFDETAELTGALVVGPTRRVPLTLSMIPPSKKIVEDHGIDRMCVSDICDVYPWRALEREILVISTWNFRKRGSFELFLPSHGNPGTFWPSCARRTIGFPTCALLLSLSYQALPRPKDLTMRVTCSSHRILQPIRP